MSPEAEGDRHAEPKAPRVRPEVAIVASWLIPGLGTFLQGAGKPGLTLMALYFALAIPTWTEAVSFYVVLGPALAVWLYSQVDVWRRAGISPRDYLKSRGGA